MQGCTEFTGTRLFMHPLSSLARIRHTKRGVLKMALVSVPSCLAVRDYLRDSSPPGTNTKRVALMPRGTWAGPQSKRG